MVSESSGSVGREGRREERRERERETEKKGREEEQRRQAKTCGEALPHSNPNVPQRSCLQDFHTVSLPKVASFFPFSLLIPTSLSGDHCAFNAKHRSRNAANTE